MNKAKRHEIFSRLQAANPHPTTELEYNTPFELLVAVVLYSSMDGLNRSHRSASFGFRSVVVMLAA